MHSIKKIYLYLVSLISLIIIIWGSVVLVNMALKTWVFKKADQNFYSYAYPACVTPARDLSGATKPELATPAECADPNYAENQRKQDEENRAAQRQRDAAQAIAMILVGAPVFYFHWKWARKEV